MSNRFTERAQRVILIAQEEAKRLNHDYVGTEHLLLGLIALGEGVAAQVVANLGVDLRRVRAEIEKIVGTGDNVMLLGEIPFTPRAKKVLELAVEEAQNMGHNYVGTEHLLLGLIREEEGVAARVMENIGVRLDVVREEVISLLGEGQQGPSQGSGSAPSGPAGHHGATPKTKSKTPTLDEFGRDLTLMAKDGKLDPVIGRESEIERVIQILAPAHQEQSRFDRRSRGGKNRHCGRVGATPVVRRSPRFTDGQARDDAGSGRRRCRHQIPRRI
jgi:ATP-dependent Clp protease ATP-binding subunit ClpC